MPVSRREHDIIGMPIGAKCQRIVRLARGWRIWLSTNDYRFGTFIELCDDGQVVRFTVRENEGDEIHLVRPNDAYIRNLMTKETV